MDREASGGDWALARARAAARLRARELTPAEHRAIRGARAEVGAALRRARVRRPEAPYTPTGTVRPLRRPRSYRGIAIAACSLALAGLALALFLPSSPAVGTSPGATAAEQAPAALRRETATSRGRSVAGVALLAAEPTPEPSAEPTPAPTAVPAAALAAAPPASAPVVGAPPGTGTGTGTGAAGASPGPGGAAGPAPAIPVPASPTPTLAPRTSAPTPSARPPNVTRFTGRVVDSRTGAGIAGVCVVVGVRACVARDPYTDATGRFTLDLPVGATWDINFTHTAYRTGYRRLVSSSVRNVDIGTIRLGRR